MRKFPDSRKNSSSVFIYFIPIIFLISCRTIPFSANSDETDFPKYLYKNLNTHSSQYYSCDQINIKYDDGNVKSANLSLNVKRGNYIYANVNYFGIEIARILLTRDSVKIINRFEKTYFFGSLNSLNTKFGFDVSYDLIESLILKGVATEGNLTQKFVKANISENDSSYFFKSFQNPEITMISTYKRENFNFSGLELKSVKSNTDLVVKLIVTKFRNATPEKLFITIQKDNYNATIVADIGTINYTKFEAKSFTVNSRYSEMDF